MIAITTNNSINVKAFVVSVFLIVHHPPEVSLPYAVHFSTAPWKCKGREGDFAVLPACEARHRTGIQTVISESPLLSQA